MALPERPGGRFRYIGQVARKWLSFFVFGLGTLVLVLGVYPVMKCCLHPRERFRQSARSATSAALRFFTRLMERCGVVRVRADPEAFRHLASKIIIANHPSLLDVVILLSLVPRGDCIVRGSLNRTLVRGIIRQLYIPNSLNFEDLMAACVDSLNRGNNLIFFPEGTRTPRFGRVPFKKGAYRLALRSGRGIIPVYIGGNDKYGLGKGDPWRAVNPQGPYLYDIRVGTELDPGAYRDLPPLLALRRLAAEGDRFFSSPPGAS
jgi:1-acyl-sn-glycerol-3-phosphate acyltransferase